MMLLMVTKEKRCFAWYQRKYRRLVVRWERQKINFDGEGRWGFPSLSNHHVDAFLSLATVHIWINKILLVG